LSRYSYAESLIAPNVISVGEPGKEQGPLSQGVQAGRQARRIRHIHGVEVRKKRPRGFK
jgi:hypothetical protein